MVNERNAKYERWRVRKILDLSEYIRKECDDCCRTDITCDKCNCNWLKAEHKEKPKISDVERAILKNIPEDCTYIARDMGGELYLYFYKPERGNAVWRGGHRRMDVFNHLFQFIKWSDIEPYNIEELLKWYKKRKKV